jgi:hypothetical protein
VKQGSKGGKIEKITGQKRKQMKVYIPKGQVQVHEEKIPGESNIADIIYGKNPRGDCPFHLEQI